MQRRMLTAAFGLVVLLLVAVEEAEAHKNVDQCINCYHVEVTLFNGTELSYACNCVDAQGCKYKDCKKDTQKWIKTHCPAKGAAELM